MLNNTQSLTYLTDPILYSPTQSSLTHYLGMCLLSGNSYILKVGSDLGKPKELHLLRPDRINIKGGGNPIPEKYEYIINGRVHQTFL